MFRIGEFSRFTRVSVKMLRHYDEIGLLVPVSVDSASGYRTYAAEQLPRLNRIIALKDLGFSLDAIATLLDDAATADDKAALLRGRRSELERSIAEDGARLRQLDALPAGGGPDRLGEYDVVLRAVPACPMATIRRRVPSLGEPIASLFEALEARVAAHKARAPASPLLLFHDDDYREADLDVEAAVPIARPFD